MKSFCKFLASGVFALGMTLAAYSAHAAVITVDVVGANWTNLTTTGVGSSLNFFNTDGITGFEEIRWGTPGGSGQSGYRFDSSAPPSFSVAVDTAFSLGDFTHFNFPISGEALTSAQLDILVDLTIDGTPIQEGPFLFSFLHDETSNACSPLPDCANDLVSVSNLVTSDTFTIDGQTFTLLIDGFLVGGSVVTDFSTVEGQTNTAELIARFTTPIAVSEPASLALLGFGLIGVALARRRIGAA